MVKKKKKKFRGVGSNYTLENIMINRNPLLREKRAELLSGLQLIREEVIERCMSQIDELREDAEKELVYTENETVRRLKYLALRNPDLFIPILRVSLIKNKDTVNTIAERFGDIIDTVTAEILPNILKGMRVLKGSSTVETYYEIHRNILHSNILSLKCLIYDDLESTCKEYLKTYNPPSQECLSEPAFESYSLNDTELSEISEIQNIKKESFKIRSYTELNKLAVENGFNFIRQRGDHAIFRNSKNHITVIPQRDIGKGLQCEILKQIGL